MKIKHLKQYIKEAVDPAFNEFVEETLRNNRVDIKVSTSFIGSSYGYKGSVYRVVFKPTADVMKFDSAEGVDVKALTTYLTKDLNLNKCVLWCKSIKNVVAQIKFPSLYTLNENVIGIIYSDKSSAMIDLTKYTGKDPNIVKRLAETQELVGYEDININKIEAAYAFDNGWHLINIEKL